MKLVTFAKAGQVEPGLWLDQDRVLPLRLALAAAGNSNIGSLQALIAGGDAAEILQAVAASDLRSLAALAASEVSLLAPLPRPHKNVFCVGRNYLEHVKEGYRARGADV